MIAATSSTVTRSGDHVMLSCLATRYIAIALAYSARVDVTARPS